MNELNLDKTNDKVYHFDIMIIGNGFDIAAGLETKYENFCEKMSLARVKKKYNQFLKAIGNKYNDSKYTKRGLQLFYEKVKQQKDNFFVKYFSEIFKNQWSEIEKEIEDIINTFDILLSSLNIECSYNDTDDDLEEYIFFRIDGIKKFNNLLIIENINSWFGWKIAVHSISDCITITNKKLNDLKITYVQAEVKQLKKDTVKELHNEFIEFTKLFSLYLNVFAHLDEVKKNIQLICKKLIIYNYTDAAERLLKGEDNSNALYIHNKFNFCENAQHEWDLGNIIFGIDDNVELNIRELNCFKKSNQRGLYNSDARYIMDIKSGLIQNIGVYGHSLDLIDLDSLRLLLADNKYLEKLTIFYYDMEAKQSLIQNLKDILTLSEYNSLYYSNRIEFIQSNKIKLTI